MSFTQSSVSSPSGQATISLLILAIATYFIIHQRRLANRTNPVSVNYHFTRKCNKTCKFCFHTEKTSHISTQEDMKRGLYLLKQAGMRKINFAGGEPFLYPDKLGWLCRFCNEELKLESVSIITNGTKVTERWLAKYGEFVDIIGVSCDSFDKKTNELIGRGTGENVKQLFRIRDWCQKFGIKFKLNTVVCKLNWQEDMAAIVQDLAPQRWKVFQVLFVEDENDTSATDAALDGRRRDARELLITREQYETFCEKHNHLESFVPEPNDLMASSYLILDGYMCFLDKGSGKEKQSRSILEVGVAKALEEVKFDKEAFVKRGGLYDWTKEAKVKGCGSAKEELEW